MSTLPGLDSPRSPSAAPPAPHPASVGKRWPLQDVLDALRPKSREELVSATGYSVAQLATLARRGLTHEEADYVCCRLGTVPELIWPDYLDWPGEGELQPPFDPNPPLHPYWGNRRFRPGEMQQAILDLARQRSGQVVSVASLAKELGRHQRPVSVHLCVKSLLAAGKLRRLVDQPPRYCLPDDPAFANWGQGSPEDPEGVPEADPAPAEDLLDQEPGA